MTWSASERVPHAFGAPEPSRNRPQGRLLSFVARDVPGLGYRRFELVADGAAQPADEPGPVENEHYRVELDAEGGYALRLVDLELGLDLVDAASAFGFGQVVRDLYGGPLQATARARPGAESPTRRGRRRLRRADPLAHDAAPTGSSASACRARSRSGSRSGRGPPASRRSRRPSASCAASGGSTSPCGS